VIGAAGDAGTATASAASVPLFAAPPVPADLTPPHSLAQRMSPLRPINLMGAGFGLAFGLLLVLSGFADPTVVHRMLLLQDPTLYLMFAAVMATAVPLLWVIERRRWRTPLGGPIEIERLPVQRRHVFGALLFGTGWAVAGTCPGPSLAMTLSGHLLGGAVVAGLFCGLLLREVTKSRAGAPVHPPAAP
jgi:uncharacterized membrane protein YedE/YeeE